MTVPDSMVVEYFSGGYEILDMTGATVLDMASEAILDPGEWFDLTSDVTTETPIVVFQGQRNSGPDDRVADSGSIRFTLRNDAGCSGGVVGYYSPDHASVRSMWGLGRIVRVSLVKDGVTDYLSQGRIVTIEPSTGNLNEKTVDVVIADWMDIAARTNMPWISLGDVDGFTDDQVLQHIFDNLDDAPDSTDFDTGTYAYAYPLSDLNDGNDKVLTVMQRLTRSGLGRIYIVGNTTSGEVLKYVSLTTLLAGGSTVATFDNDFESLALTRQAYTRAKRVNVNTIGYLEHPSVVQLNSATQVIYKINPGETIAIKKKYVDGDGAVDAGADVQCVSLTSFAYGFNSAIDFLGTDLIANLTGISYTVGVNEVKAFFTNSGATTGYLMVSMAGHGLLYKYPYLYTVEDATIPEGQGVTIDWNAPYQNTYAGIQAIGDYLMDWFGADSTQVKSLTFTPTVDAENYAKMRDCKPGTLVRVTDDVTGIDADMLAIGFELQIWNSGKLMRETLYLSRTV